MTTITKDRHLLHFSREGIETIDIAHLVEVQVEELNDRFIADQWVRLVGFWDELDITGKTTRFHGILELDEGVTRLRGNVNKLGVAVRSKQAIDGVHQHRDDLTMVDKVGANEYVERRRLAVELWPRFTLGPIDSCNIERSLSRCASITLCTDPLALRLVFLPCLLLALTRAVLRRAAATALHELAVWVVRAELLHHAALIAAALLIVSIFLFRFDTGRRRLVQSDVVLKVLDRVLKEIREDDTGRLGVEVRRKATHSTASTELTHLLVREHVGVVNDPATQDERRRPDGDTSDIFFRSRTKDVLVPVQSEFTSLQRRKGLVESKLKHHFLHDFWLIRTRLGLLVVRLVKLLADFRVLHAATFRKTLFRCRLVLKQHSQNLSVLGRKGFSNATTTESVLRKYVNVWNTLKERLYRGQMVVLHRPVQWRVSACVGNMTSAMRDQFLRAIRMSIRTSYHVKWCVERIRLDIVNVGVFLVHRHSLQQFLKLLEFAITCARQHFFRHFRCKSINHQAIGRHTPTMVSVDPLGIGIRFRLSGQVQQWMGCHKAPWLKLTITLRHCVRIEGGEDDGRASRSRASRWLLLRSMVERGVMARWSSILMILVWFTVLAIVAAVSGGDRKEASRRAGIARFIADRSNQSLMCLYTFDQVREETAWPSHSSSSRSVGNFDGDEGDLNVSSAILPTFEEHVGRDCPFGDLQFDPEIVIPLDSKTGAGSSKQLGVHLTVDPEKNAKRIQIASRNVVSASEFFSMAVLHPNGVTFEMVLRRRVPLNQTMTLFRVGNSFDGCVDPGFRLDLNGYHVLTMIFFIPLLEDETEACYEQRLFSVNVQEECVLPSYQENADNNPPVHITVVINPSKDQREWTTSFYLTYVDSASLQRKECIATDSQPMPDATLLTDFIQGTYRLFIGNNPRDGSEPQRRPILAMSRDFRDPFTEYKSPEKRLREAIKQKLMSIDGPRLPKTLKFFDTKSVSLKILGLHLPPIGVDTPLAWVRGKLDDFKREHADVLVDFIVNSLRQGGSIITRSRQGTIQGGNSSNTTDNVLYPDADASVFDLFHFALYKKPLTAMEVRDNWNSWLLPSRPFPSKRQTTHIAQDEIVLLQLLQLHSVYDDVHLELVEYPEHGKLYLSPDMVLIAKDNLTVFKNLSVEDQKSIFFRPSPGQNNNNLPAQGRFGFRRQNRPYAVVQYRAWAATAGRPINSTHTAEIRIFVQPINYPPRLRQAELNVSVLIDQPILLTLKGLDEGSPADSRPSSSSYSHNHRVLRQSDLQETMESINGGDYSVAQVFNLANGMDFTTSDAPTNEPSHFVRIVQLPRYGMLYDRKMKGKSKQLQKTSMYKTDGLEGYEIRRADIPNQAFSTDLIYIYSGANGISHGTVVDSMEFHLTDGDLGSLSPIGRIYFHLSADAPEEKHVEATVIDVQEDSLVVVTLSDIEPLIGQVGSRFCFVITSLPTHGLLYQYEMGSDENDAGVVTSGAQHNLGQRVEVNSLVEDSHGRVVYVPEPNYFNSFPDDHGSSVEIAHMNVPLENFEFKIQLEDECGSRRSDKSSSLDDLSKLSVTRVVRIHVVNTPDELVILPPTYFVTNQGRGDPVTVPIIFEDADGYEGSYQVILDAEDDSSAFEFGHLVTDDDVLRYCPFERPCYLTRSINESYQSNGNGDNDEHPDRRMMYVIRNRNMKPSHVEVFGSKNAIQAALPKMVFRDWSMWGWSEEHTASFEVSIKRVNSSFDAATRSRFYIEYSNTGNDDDDESFISRTISKLTDVVWLGVAFLVMSFILSNAACCSYGFCCCCSKPRLKRRRALEARRRDYVAEVAQNDFEYSQLLMEVANLMLEPDLVIPTCLLRSLRLYQGNVGSSLLEDLCLRSLLPILETERQSTRLAYRLVQLEFKAEARARALRKPEIRTFLEHSSIASKVLATFCRFIGHDWMYQIHSNLLQVLDQGSDDLTIPFCRAVDECIEAIPPEIVILCRASAQLFGSNDFMDFRAVHLIFFNHFLAPSLWFVRKCPGGSKKTVISKSDQKRLRQLVSQLVGLMSHYDGATSHHGHSPKHQYHQLLQVIATSPRVVDSYLPSSSEAPRCQLMSLCLMNLHSVLETILPELEKEYKSDEGHHDIEKPGKYDEYGENEENSIIRLKRVLRTLNFPVASAELLASHFEAAVANETFQAQGLSFAEWEDRITHFGRTMNSEQKKEKLPRAVSMLAVDVHEDSNCDDTVFTTSQTQRNLDPRRTVYSDEHLSSPQEWQEDITIFRRSDCEKPSLHSRRSIEFEF